MNVRIKSSENHLISWPYGFWEFLFFQMNITTAINMMEAIMTIHQGKCEGFFAVSTKFLPGKICSAESFMFQKSCNASWNRGPWKY